MEKRIAFTVSNDLVYDQRMIRICSSLQNAGYQCTLIGRKKRNSPLLQTQPFQQKRFRLIFSKGKLFYLELNLRLCIYLLFTRHRAICAIDCDTALAGIFCAGVKRLPFIFDAHEIFAHTPEVKDRKWIQKFWLWVEKKAFQYALFSYTVGEELGEHFKSLYGNTLGVVRNVPILKSKIPNTSISEKFILYQGALNAGRGLEHAILAMKRIPIKLKIAGEGDLSQKLRELVKDNGLENKVDFLGFVKPAELPKLTQEAWLGLNVSENRGLSYYLSLNNKLFDYMHAKLPSLINPFPEYVTINKQFEIGVITKSSVEDIVTNVNYLLEHDEKYLELRDNCAKAREVFNWGTEERILKNLYKQHLSE